MNVTYSVEKLIEEFNATTGKYTPSEIVFYKNILDDSGGVVAKIRLAPEDVQRDGISEEAKQLYMSTAKAFLQGQLEELINDNPKSSHPSLGTLYGRNLTRVLEMVVAVEGYIEKINGTLAAPTLGESNG